MNWASIAKIAVMTQPLAVVGLYYERTESLTRTALETNAVSLFLVALLAVTSILASFLMACESLRRRPCRFGRHIPRLLYATAGVMGALAAIILGALAGLASPTLVADYLIYAGVIAAAGLLIEREQVGRQ
jgi:hypothetical protein